MKGAWRCIVAAVLALVVILQPTAAWAVAPVSFRPPRVTVYPYYPGQPAEAELLKAIAEFYPRFPYPAVLEAAPGISVWHGEDPACPASLRVLRGLTYPGDLTVWLNAAYDLATTASHELGHVAQRKLDVLPTGDADGRLMHQVWVAEPGPDGEEDFANAVGAHLLGLKWSTFVRWFPAALAKMRLTAGRNTQAQVWSGGIAWWFQDPLGQASGWRQIAADGRFLVFDGQQWREQ